jgi:hypothetical protein
MHRRDAHEGCTKMRFTLQLPTCQTRLLPPPPIILVDGIQVEPQASLNYFQTARPESVGTEDRPEVFAFIRAHRCPSVVKTNS